MVNAQADDISGNGCAGLFRDFEQWEKTQPANRDPMHPTEFDNSDEREERIRLWCERDHPKRDAFPRDPREWERHHAEIAQLTPSGEKLLGLEPR